MVNVGVMVQSVNKKEHENKRGKEREREGGRERDMISAVESFIFTILRFESIIPYRHQNNNEYATISRLILLITFSHRKSIHIHTYNKLTHTRTLYEVFFPLQ